MPPLLREEQLKGTVVPHRVAEPHPRSDKVQTGLPTWLHPTGTPSRPKAVA